MKYFLFPLVLLWTSCSINHPAPELLKDQIELFEFSDLYQAGDLQFQKSLQVSSDLQHSWQTNRSQVLLILMTVAYDDGESEQVQQSGVVVSDGRYILTAGHGFQVDAGHIVDVRAETVSGKKLNLELLRLSVNYQDKHLEDWAILQPSIRLQSHGVKIAGPDSYSREVFLLGFPGSLGLDDVGQVIHIHEVQRNTIYPLGIMCDRLQKKPSILRPRFGTIPIRGMSGAPVFDRHGMLVGLFSSMSRTRSLAGWQYILSMSNVPISTLDSLTSK